MSDSKFKSRNEALRAVNHLADEATAMTGCLHPDEMGPAREYIAELRRKLRAIVRKSIRVKARRR